MGINQENCYCEGLPSEVIKNDGQRCYSMTSAYERELREVLAGTDKGVKAVTRSCSPEEKQRMFLIQRRPFLVVRAAGSGMEGSGDLLALRGDCCFPIEVKTTKADKLYFSGRTKDQLNAMIREGERSNLMPLYAHRRKGVRGDSWRIFRVETQGLSGTLRRLVSHIPALPLNRNGTPFIDWEQGMPLNKFISLLCSHEEESTAALNNLKQRAEKQGVQTNVARPSPSKTSQDILAELERRRSSVVNQILRNKEQ
jgi:Holliday junction resolvase